MRDPLPLSPTPPKGSWPRPRRRVVDVDCAARNSTRQFEARSPSPEIMLSDSRTATTTPAPLLHRVIRNSRWRDRSEDLLSVGGRSSDVRQHRGSVKQLFVVPPAARVAPAETESLTMECTRRVAWSMSGPVRPVRSWIATAGVGVLDEDRGVFIGDARVDQVTSGRHADLTLVGERTKGANNGAFSSPRRPNDHRRVPA